MQPLIVLSVICRSLDLKLQNDIVLSRGRGTGRGGKSPFSQLSEPISPSSLLFWANFSPLPKRLRFFFSLLSTFPPYFSLLPTFFGPFLPPPYSIPPPSWVKGMEFIFAVGFLAKIELKYHWMIFDFGQLKNSISCSCIFRKSITSHTKLCNSVRHFYYGLGRAATAMGAQMSKIFGHETGDTVDFLKKIASILPYVFLVGSCVYFRGPIN